MKTNPKPIFLLLVGVLAGMMCGLFIRGQQLKTPPGYLITEAEVTDPAALQTYGEKLAKTLVPFNHHFVVRSSKIQVLEGDVLKSRVVIIAFDSVEKAREWYDSPAYAALRPIRQNATKARIFIVEGLAPQ
jgi:uncharacterized protein (DUF1330 family)